MRQFTMNIDDSLLLAAKKHALETGRTVSEIVRDLVAREVGWNGQVEPAPLDDEQVWPVLTNYSNGRTSRRRAMDEIGLSAEKYSEFVDLMRRHCVPWPKIDREQVEREAEIVVAAIKEAGDED